MADKEADVAEFAALIATFSGDDLKHDKAVEDRKALAEAFETALKEYNDAVDASSKAEAEWQTAASAANSTFDVNVEIENLKNEIARSEEKIIDYKSAINSKEDAIASKKAEIEIINTQLKLGTAIVNNWKAQIEAAIEAQK